LEVAGWLAARGARYLTLVSRRPPSPEAEERLRQLETSGAVVTVVSCDVANGPALAQLMDRFGADLPRLAGVVHAAGVLEDAIVLHQDWSAFERVMLPKVDGAANLHRLTSELPLDFFVLFSSAASLLGAAGQANYAAANAYLDALAHCRRGQGLRATSVDWGPWAGPGMAMVEAARWKSLGMEPLDPKRAVAVLDRVVNGSAQVGVFDVDWRRFGERQPRTLDLLADLCVAPRHSAPVPALLAELAGLPRKQRLAAVERLVRTKVAAVLGLPSADDIPARQSLLDLGLDSLMALELKSLLESGLGVALSPTLVFDYPSVEAIAVFLAAIETPRVAAAAARPRGHSRLANVDIEQLAETEAEALLLEELERLEH
jgi:acyl carrier protein